MKQSKSIALAILLLAVLTAVFQRVESGSNLRPADATGLSDREFWALIGELSEPGGLFRSDNFVSNEVAYQLVIPELQARVGTGGVYLGVGPDQNYTYIAATKPRLAFILDIRRQNMLQHLLYKALFELSGSRVDFLSRLFSRRVPDDIKPGDGIGGIIAKFRYVAPSQELFAENLSDVLGLLQSGHAFRLRRDDPTIIEYVYKAFYFSGPELRYSSRRRLGSRRFPTYGDLLLETDGEGENHNYLATEENFRFIQTLHAENRIVPLVGDFAGEKSLVGLGRYLMHRNLKVSIFYTSNVEYYLFQNQAWERFFDNVATLPLADGSTFVRSYFNNFGYRHPAQRTRYFSVTLLDSMAGLLAAHRAGDLRSYYSLIERSR